MTLYRDGDPVLKVYRGSTEVDKVYRRERVVFTRPALPQITRFETAPSFLAASAGAGQQLNFIVQTTGATSITVTDPDGTVIDTSASPATTAPTAPSTRYTLTAANVEGTVVSHYDFYRTVPPSFTSGLDITYSQVAGPVGVQYRAQIRWRIDGTSNPFPRLAWIDPPASHHLSDPDRATTPDGQGTIYLTVTPGGQRLTFHLRLRATNPVTGETADATGTVTIPARTG